MAVYRECFVIVKRQYPIDFKLERRTTSHYALFFRARDLLQSDSPNSLCNNLSSTIRMLESHLLASSHDSWSLNFHNTKIFSYRFYSQVA